MRNLGSSSMQTLLICYRQAKKPPTLSGSDHRSSELQIPIWGAKQARSSIYIPFRWGDCDWTKFGVEPAEDDISNTSEQIPIWGAKRARNSTSIQTEWRDWANLGDGPAGLIAERLLGNDVADYICFRAVCRPWRLCCTDPRADCILERRFHPLHWIMLRETGDSPRCRFMNVSTGCSRYVHLPELCGHDVFGPTTEGLLVLLDRTTWVVRLLNPLTRQAVDLPPATALMAKSDRRDLFLVSGAGLADDYTFAVHFRWIKTLAVLRPGDVNWTVVDRGRWLLPALSFAGRFYCATTEAVMVVETNADQTPRLVIAANLTRPFATIMMDTVHIVDNGGDLILVDRQCNGNDNRKYKVYRVDLDSKKMVPIRGLGGRAVFIGIERALSVSPLVFPSISEDAIYLGFDGQTTGKLDNSPIHLLHGIAESRQFEDNNDNNTLYEPLGLDTYLSWCVTGYRDTLRDIA